MIFNLDTNYQNKMHLISGYTKTNIQAPFVNAYVSTLGGYLNASIMIVVSLDNKSSWTNGILENSHYCRFSIDRNGTIEQFHKSYKIPLKFRKSKALSLKMAIAKINQYLINAQNDITKQINANI